MTPEQTLDRIERLLTDERTAIRAMDARGVEAFAAEKEGLFRSLTAGGIRPEHRARLAKVLNEVRRNAVLLANARDCVRGVLAACGVDTVRRPGRQYVANRTAVRLSVRGLASWSRCSVR